MTIHDVKFVDVGIDDYKRFEIRKDDKRFSDGDKIQLWDNNPVDKILFKKPFAVIDIAEIFKGEMGRECNYCDVLIKRHSNGTFKMLRCFKNLT